MSRGAETTGVSKKKHSPGLLEHFAVPSGDVLSDPTKQAKEHHDDSEWYQFETQDLLEADTPEVSALESRDMLLDGKEHLEVFALSTSRRGVETQFRKSWGNFTNIFDEQGRQKSCIWRSELSNYMPLHTCTPIGHSCQQQEITFLASLFTGNYPKPLFRSNWSWRMRWNVFVAGVDEDVLVKLQSTPDGKKEAKENCPGGHGDTDDEKVLHMGEMHLYLHVERGHQQPVYQNLCFFFDPSLVSLVKSMPEGRVSRTLEKVAAHLKQQMSMGKFVSQLYFPIEKSRFSAVDQSVLYFELRQRDLQVAITIANEQVPFSFLHRAPIPGKVTSSGSSLFSSPSRQSNSSRRSWSMSKPTVANAIPPMSSAGSWRRRNTWDD